MISSRSATVTLPTDEQIHITREFDAPAELVWKAMTTPELVKRWWPADHGEMTKAEMDFRVGGAWRYELTGPDGVVWGFGGEYLEIVPGERIVQTEVFDGFPDAKATDTMTLVDLGDGRSRYEVLVQHTSKEHRDGHVNSGMEDGLQVALDKLERVAISLREAS